MRIKKSWLVFLCLLPFLFVSCSGSGSGSGSLGTLELKLTDNPGDYLSVFVTITGIYAIVDDSGPYRIEFADFSSPAVVEETGDTVTVDLIQLYNQTPISFALGNLPAGRLDQIRLIISEASLVAYEDVVEVDGNDDGEIEHVEATYPVKVPSGAQSGIKLNPRDIEIQSGSLTSLTLDFDADKSIVRLGGVEDSSRDYDFILKPVIFILEATGTIATDTETVATGLNFPTDLQAVEGEGAGSLAGSVLVANAGTSGTNAQTVLPVDVSETWPIDATAITPPFASSADIFEGEPLVNSPSGLAQYMDLVWISNSVSATVLDSAGTVSELYTTGGLSALSAMYIDDNLLSSESVEGLIQTSGVEFGGFAPSGLLANDEFVVYQTNGNGSITGIIIAKQLIFDVLGAGSFGEPTDLAFVPPLTPIATGNPAGTPAGWLFVTNAATDQIGVVSLTTIGGAVGDEATRVSGEIVQTLSYPWLSNPVGIAYSPGADLLYIANRGNGTITVISPDGVEVATYDTGFGANALNGIDVAADGTVYVTNTAGNNDPSADAGSSTLEKVNILP
jgi:hypothetical protein